LSAFGNANSVGSIPEWQCSGDIGSNVIAGNSMLVGAGDMNCNSVLNVARNYIFVENMASCNSVNHNAIAIRYSLCSGIIGSDQIAVAPIFGGSIVVEKKSVARIPRKYIAFTGTQTTNGVEM
jgi:hypothetical protein